MEGLKSRMDTQMKGSMNLNTVQQNLLKMKYRQNQKREQSVCDLATRTYSITQRSDLSKTNPRSKTFSKSHVG